MHAVLGSEAVEGGAAVLLERASHLAALNERMGAVIHERRGGIVVVTGEAGVGKTALVRRFSSSQGDTVGVLSGGCDALFTPRPLGPFHDVAPGMDEEVEGLVERGERPYRVASAVLRNLADRGPTILVIEDVHWADEATLDVLGLVARRIEGVPALMIITYRDDGLDRGHPVRLFLGELSSAGGVTRVRLPALSAGAVAQLARPHGVDPLDLYAKTAGNPFFVTEVLAAPDDRIPETVRDAVLARAARVSVNARRVVEAASVLQPHAEFWLLEAIEPEASEHLDECLDSGMLVAASGATAFRHELARIAIEELLAPNRRRALHRAALAALSAPPAGPPDVARLAHHAEAAGDSAAVLRYAASAAASSAAAGAHREAAAQYARALRFADGVDIRARGALFDHHSYECYVTGNFEAALESTERALACHSESGEARSEGDALRTLSRLLRYVGRPDDAARAGQAAVAVLERLEPGHELAMAYCTVSYLSMSVEDTDGTVRWASKALALAERVGDLDAELYARINLATLKYLAGSADSVDTLESCLRRASSAGLEEHAGRCYVTLTFWAPRTKSHAAAGRYLDAGLDYCAKQGLDLWRAYLIVSRARSQLDYGRWDEASESASTIIRDPRTSPVPRAIALAVLGLVRARRGDPECWPPLDEAWRLAEPTRELQRIELVAMARAEAAWLEGNQALVASATEAALELASLRGASWIVGALSMWRRRAGLGESLAANLPPPFAAQATGDWALAADLWRQLDCPYEAALALVDSDDVSAMKRGLVELQRLGAKPAASITARRLRARGVLDLPRGPRQVTQANSAKLTAREVQILGLLTEGMQNPEIARHLFVSTKTVDHHVSAILAKLEVRSRSEAAARARDLFATVQRDTPI
jgi:DNA-binding CsgD family transcriptional regulator/tetratricopeptide (TPR) repeat protein